MHQYQNDFIEFTLKNNILCFGEFTLKSGRLSPYFYNSGLFNTGELLAKLGHFYAAAISAAHLEFDVLFGPAYKGIPLATAAATRLAEDYGVNKAFCFNRKEAKTHGEGGNIVGAPLNGKVLIIDDVVTAGTAFRESMQLIDAAGAKPAGIVIAVDRQERGQSERSAIQEIEQDFGVPVISIIKLENIIHYLQQQGGQEHLLKQMHEYQQQYGIQ